MLAGRVRQVFGQARGRVGKLRSWWNLPHKRRVQRQIVYFQIFKPMLKVVQDVVVVVAACCIVLFSGMFGVQLNTPQVVDVAKIVDIRADRLTTVEILEFSMMRISGSVTSHTKLLEP